MGYGIARQTSSEVMIYDSGCVLYVLYVSIFDCGQPAFGEKKAMVDGVVLIISKEARYTSLVRKEGKEGKGSSSLSRVLC